MLSNAFFSVAKALNHISVSSDTLAVLTKDPYYWQTFGKTDSNILRAKLFRMYRDKKIDNETIFIIHFFFAVVKNKKRVLDSIENLPEEVKTLSSVMKAKDFIRDNLVQYVSQETSRNFAVVHLPTTMPGLDIMLTALTLPNTQDSLTNHIFTKQTFAQLNINKELQSINKAAQENFWNNVVKTSKNQARVERKVTEELKFHEDYYNTSAADTYNLIDINFNEVPPKNSTTGYTKEEIVNWFVRLKHDQDLKTGKVSSSSSAASASASATSSHKTSRPATPQPSTSTTQQASSTMGETTSKSGSPFKSTGKSGAS